MMKTALIANLNARLCKRSPEFLNKLREVCELHEVRLDLCASFEALDNLCQNYAQTGVERLFILGGDGTISCTLTMLTKKYRERNKTLPKLVLLGGGTANVLIQNLRIGSNPIKNLERHLRTAATKTAPLRALEIEGRLGFLFADGLAVNYLNAFYANKGSLFNACTLVVKLLISGLYNGKAYKRLVYLEDKILLCNRQTYSPKSLVSFVSVLDRIPTGIKFFGPNMSTPQYMTVLDFGFSPYSLGWRLPLILFLRSGSYPYFSKHFECKSLEIQKTSPWSYTLDGEIYQSTKESLFIHLGPMVEFELSS